MRESEKTLKIGDVVRWTGKLSAGRARRWGSGPFRIVGHDGFCFTLANLDGSDAPECYTLGKHTCDHVEYGHRRHLYFPSSELELDPFLTSAVHALEVEA